MNYFFFRSSISTLKEKKYKPLLIEYTAQRIQYQNWQDEKKQISFFFLFAVFVVAVDELQLFRFNVGVCFLMDFCKKKKIFIPYPLLCFTLLRVLYICDGLSLPFFCVYQNIITKCYEREKGTHTERYLWTQNIITSLLCRIGFAIYNLYICLYLPFSVLCVLDVLCLLKLCGIILYLINQKII